MRGRRSCAGRGDAEGEAGEEAADVGEVVDADDGDEVGGEADDEVDGGELDDGPAQALELGPGEGELAVGEQHDEDAGDAEDSS